MSRLSTKYYGVHDSQQKFSGVFTDWEEARETLAGIHRQTGRAGHAKKFALKKDAEYFAQWGSCPPDPSMQIVDQHTVVAYTDGSCRMNMRGEKCAGIGVYFGQHHPCNRAEPFVALPLTNNRAELTAIRRAIELAHDPLNQEHFPSVADAPKLVIYTDSSYARDSLGSWRDSWQRTNFRDDTIMNRDVIEPIWDLMDNCTRQIEIVWRKGHAGIHGNEMADRLANRGALNS